MIDIQIKILGQCARHQAGAAAGAVVVAHAFGAIKIRLVEFAVSDVVMVFNAGNLNPQVARQREHGNFGRDEIDAYNANNISQTIGIVVDIHAQRQNCHYLGAATQGFGCGFRGDRLGSLWKFCGDFLPG